MRPPSVHHCTSEPFCFFGRAAELGLLNRALNDDDISVIGFVGAGGQGKTAILQRWLQQQLTPPCRWDGLFFWSFYRGKDADLCLEQLYAYAEGHARLGMVSRPRPALVSASYSVDHLLPVLRGERWVLILDGTEVVQYESGPWSGRFVHPELGRLLEELASGPLPGVVVLTTRFGLPTLERRRHARLVSLGQLDVESARSLLASVGVSGSTGELDAAAEAAGWHAKGVELLGTWLSHFAAGQARRLGEMPALAATPSEKVSGTVAGTARRVLRTTVPDTFSDEERGVARVVAAFQTSLAAETRDILALATAFRQPPTEARLLEYLNSAPVETVLHQTWQRTYLPFRLRAATWLAQQVELLVKLRLLERVGSLGQTVVIDAHPLVRRGFEHYLGAQGHGQSATSRAEYLSGRPDRRPPATLDEAREEVELFHAYCDAGLWNEADSTVVSLDNPKHRFLAPAFERDLLLRFFPDGDWRRPPLWPGFGRWRSLAISLEMLGQFDEALAVYRPADLGLRGDALIVLGRLQPLLAETHVPPPWQSLWQAYRAHALCLAGRTDEALALAKTLVPADIYEWIHVFECLMRLDSLRVIDLRSVLYRPVIAQDQRWQTLVLRRLRADYQRVTHVRARARRGSPDPALAPEYRKLIAAYDRAGLPWERAMVRLSYARWLLEDNRPRRAFRVAFATLKLARRYRMYIVLVDALELLAELAKSFPNSVWERGGPHLVQLAQRKAARLRSKLGYAGPARP
jgi:tetratricopeptide (TPR) repeat protein